MNLIPVPKYLFLCSLYLAPCTVTSSPFHRYPLCPACPVVLSSPLGDNPGVMPFHPLSPSSLHAFSLPINILQLSFSLQHKSPPHPP